MVALHNDDIMKKLGFALAALLLANSGYAQTPMPSAEKSFTPSTQEELVLDTSSKRAHVEVWFSGGQKERFVFEEGTLSVIEKNGIALRQVGKAHIEMGSRKLHVVVTREDLKPDVFHVQAMVGTDMQTGTSNAHMVLTPGEQKTMDMPSIPTQISIKRLR